MLTRTLIALAVTSALAAPVAFAQEPIFAGSGLFAFAPRGTAIAGPEEVYTVHLVARDPGGAAMEGLKLKLTATRGKVREVTEVQPGVYEVLWSPGVLDTATTVTLSASAKTPAKKVVETSVQLTVVPGGERSVDLVATPAGGVVGELSSVALKSASHAPLTRVSHGTIGRWDRGAATYSPDAVKYPHLAIITAAAPEAPLSGTDYTVLRMTGKVNFPVVAPAGAQVAIEIDGKTFGPVVAGSDGKAAVPLEIAPGHSSATKRVTVDGSTSTEPLDLKIPPSRRVQLMPLPLEVPTAQALAIRWVAVTPAGEPDERANATLTASAGTVGAARHLGNGVYEAMLSLAPGTASTTLTLALPGEDGQTDSIEVLAFDAPIERVALRTVPEVLDVSATEAALYIYVEGPGKKDVTAADVDVAAAHAKLLGAPGLSGDGIFGVRLSLDATEAPTFAASVTPASLGKHPAALVVDPVADRVVADGQSLVAVRVGALDAWGRPVPDVSINLRVDSGDGAVTPSVTTDGEGTAVVGYRAGVHSGLVTITASSGALSSANALLQAPEGALGVSLPPGGSAASLGADSTWALLHPVLRFGDDTASLYDVPDVPKGAQPAPVPVEPADTTTEPDATTEPVADAAATTGTPSETQPTETSAVVETVTKPERTPSEIPSGVRAFVSLALDSYHFSQTPSDAPGELLPQPFELSGALPVGGQVGVRGFIDENIGFDVAFGMSGYSAVVPAFGDQAVSDTLTHARVDGLFRYPVAVGSGAFYVDARAGFHYRDMLLLTGSVDAGQVDLWTIMHPALAVGGDLGLELDGVYVNAGATVELDHGSTPYGTSYRLLVGYAVADRVSAELGLDGMSRSTQELDGATVLGDLTDGALGARLGVAYTF